jgi:hypothetical protein
VRFFHGSRQAAASVCPAKTAFLNDRSRRLQDSHPPEHVGQPFPALQRLARLVLARDLLARATDDSLLHLVGMTTTPSTSPKTRSPRRTFTPAHTTGTSRSTMRARPLVSSGPMPPQNTGKRIARICFTSRTRPSVTHPTAPRAALAVESSSPHGAMRSVGPSHASTTTSPGARSSTSAISTS